MRAAAATFACRRTDECSRLTDSRAHRSDGQRPTPLLLLASDEGADDDYSTGFCFCSEEFAACALSSYNSLVVQRRQQVAGEHLVEHYWSLLLAPTCRRARLLPLIVLIEGSRLWPSRRRRARERAAECWTTTTTNFYQQPTAEGDATGLSELAAAASHSETERS